METAQNYIPIDINSLAYMYGEIGAEPLIRNLKE
jgi:hypothetical protein